MKLEKVKPLFVFSIMIFSPFLTCSAGMYYLDLFDSFAISVPLSACAIIEYYIFVRWIPFWQLQAETLEHTGEKAPRWVERMLEGNILFVVLIGNFALFFISQVFSAEYYRFLSTESGQGHFTSVDGCLHSTLL